ncbi:MAG: hypothetical protein CVV30_01970 [Methanomicrobiales archaeon HGW-Methanomicrobiales-1]|jgi:hypothetical protein|nr:MAG: hypothetical protein CVV30_01970 [Methanomicrobiales archaeon HGW-Methanomicrobiales-1]
MGEKKQKEKTIAQWKKFVVVGACVLFVVLMIVSGMGFGWLSAFSVVKPGDVAVIDYTVYDAAGNPLLTTDQTLFKQAAAQGKGMLYSKQISITSNQSLAHPLFPVEVYSTSSGWGDKFALFKPEYDAMSSGIVGMKVNGQKRITIPSSSSMTQVWSPEMLKRNGMNLSDINVGDILTMAVSDNPEEMASNQSALTYIRIGEISQKTDEGAVVDFGYPSMDIRVVSINGK